MNYRSTTHAADASPSVTIVVSFRERWSLTLATLNAIFRCTPPPFRLFLLDTGLPEDLRIALHTEYPTGRVEILPMPRPGMWPNQARQTIASSIDTPFVVFIDNDVIVQPDWLGQLVACAEETGAGIVGPLYMWGEDETSDLVHMAGGELTITTDGEKTVMGERHRHINQRSESIQPALQRQECDFAEFHCLLMRREVLQARGMFDAGIVCVHEHIHASLLARQLGYGTWMEPTARVFYLAHKPWMLGELPQLRERWSAGAAEQSIHRFAERWNVVNDERSFGGVRAFIGNHTGAVDLLRAPLQTVQSAHAVMDRAELAQTPFGLMAQAERRGYTPNDLNTIAQCLLLAMRLSNGGYRACGRPFINHVIGTASALVHYGFELRVILAALLHAAYTHSIPHDAPDPNTVAHQIMAVLTGINPTLERSVRSYTLRHTRYPALLQREAGTESLMPVQDAELLLLETANSIDMYLSLEVLATGQPEPHDKLVLNAMVRVCNALGVPGMGRTLLDAREADLCATPSLRIHPQPGSFRLTATGTVNMARGVNPSTSVSHRESTNEM